MANNELANRFATECLGWMCVTFASSVDRPNGTVEFDKAWRNSGGEWVLGINDAFPPFGEDTPEGWAAFKQWVEPWIKERGLEWEYIGMNKLFHLRRAVGCLWDWVYVATARGPLPTAAIKACLELGRKETRHED